MYETHLSKRPEKFSEKGWKTGFLGLGLYRVSEATTQVCLEIESSFRYYRNKHGDMVAAGHSFLWTCVQNIMLISVSVGDSILTIYHNSLINYFAWDFQFGVIKHCGCESTLLNASGTYVRPFLLCLC